MAVIAAAALAAVIVAVASSNPLAEASPCQRLFHGGAAGRLHPTANLNARYRKRREPRAHCGE